jgi:hypothetical protein
MSFDVRMELLERRPEDTDGAVLLVVVDLGIVAFEVTAIPSRGVVFRVEARIEAPDLQAIAVRDALDPRASDSDIAAYASENGYVVLTTDDDFFALAETCGCIYTVGRSC